MDITELLFFSICTEYGCIRVFVNDEELISLPKDAANLPLIQIVDNFIDAAITDINIKKSEIGVINWFGC